MLGDNNTADELFERLRICIAVEEKAAEIYREFAALFPDERDFWDELAKEEDTHAYILAVASGLDRVGRLPDYTVPTHLSVIKETLDIAHIIEEKIKAKTISLKEAAEGALELEMSASESYLNDVMSKVTDSETINKLQRLLNDTDSHVKRLRRFIADRGFEQI
jgi:rubrerythrin